MADANKAMLEFIVPRLIRAIIEDIMDPRIKTAN
jgi:hypothetical protein